MYLFIFDEYMCFTEMLQIDNRYKLFMYENIHEKKRLCSNDEISP